MAVGAGAAAAVRGHDRRVPCSPPSARPAAAPGRTPGWSTFPVNIEVTSRNVSAFHNQDFEINSYLISANCSEWKLVPQQDHLVISRGGQQESLAFAHRTSKAFIRPGLASLKNRVPALSSSHTNRRVVNVPAGV